LIRLIRITNPVDPSRDRVIEDVEPEYLTLEHLMRLYGCDTLEFDTWAATVSVSVNGHTWERSLWSEVTPRGGDSVVIAPIVHGGGILRTLASVAIIAAAAAVSVMSAGAGVALLGMSIAMTSTMLAGAVSIAGNLLLSAFMGPSSPSSKSSSPSYDPDGPKSLARSGTVIPKGNGTFRWGGNIISSFTEIAGSDQFINALACYGFGPARSITDIEINGKPISSYQNVQYYTRLGTNDQTEIAQFNQIVNGYPQSTQCLAGQAVVIPGTGVLTQAIQVDVSFPSGLFVETSLGHIIPAVMTYQVFYRTAAVGSTPAGDWIPVVQPQTTAPVVQLHADGSAYLPHAWGVVATDMPAGSGVVYALDDGPHTPGDKWTGTLTTENFAPNGNHYTYQKPAAGEWQLLDINMNYVQVLTWTDGYVEAIAAQTTPYYSRTQILGLAPAKYDVQIIKYGTARLHDDVFPGDNWAPDIGQDLWVHSVNEVAYLDLVYPNMILVAVRALATSQLSGQNLSITALVEHGLRTRDTGLMPAELMAYEEDNPACVAEDMLLDDLYGGGAWPGVVPPNIERYIDEWVAWAENNDTLVADGNGNSIRMCVYNGVFDNESDLWTQLQSVTGMSRAAIVPVGTDYAVALDAPVDAPVQMFTVGNILQDSFSEAWLPIDERANQVEVQFADSTRYYKQDNPLVYMDPTKQNTGAVPKPVRINGRGITIPAQAWHHARYKERGNQFLLRSGSFRTDTDGIACRPYNVVALQHDVPQWGCGGRTLPGSTANALLLDRNDVPFVAGTNYTVMVQHPDVLRLATANISAVAASTSPAGYTLTVPSWANNTRITRALVVSSDGKSHDCAVLRSDVQSVIVSPPPGFVPLAGQTVSLHDTDVLETAAVASVTVQGTEALVQLATPLSRAPEDYSNYIYGVAGATKWVRITNIKRASENRSMIEWLDYDSRIYDVATPIIGEASAIVKSNPGVINLSGKELFKTVSGSYVSYASLAWQNGPDTAGVGIYAKITGSTATPKLVERLGAGVTSWQGQQAPGSSYDYSVIGFDAKNLYAGFTTAPTVTIDAVGIATNLLLDSTFASGFTYWSVTPRAGDTFVPTFANDGEAEYTVAGSAITASTTFAFQMISRSKWSVGDYLLLSGYFEDTCVSGSAPNVGQVIFGVFFLDASGNQTGVRQCFIPLNGTTPTLNRTNTASFQIPAGTADIGVYIGIGGTTVNIPVGSTLTFSHLLLEESQEGVVVASAWADLDVQGNVLDIFQSGSSTGLRVQGSVLPTFTGTFTYSSSDSAITISWGNIAILWPDGAVTQIQPGSMEFTGLAQSTNYWAFLYFDIMYGGVKAAAPQTGAAGTPALLATAFDIYADAACRQDGRIALTSGGFQMATVATGSGSPGGSGITSNPYPVACTVRGTPLLIQGVGVSNEEIQRRFAAGEDVYLDGRRGPERIRSAEWVSVPYTFRLHIEGCDIYAASASHTLRTEDGHYRWCSTLRERRRVETVAQGFRALHPQRIEGAAEVLRIELDGPDHEYMVGTRAATASWTHNAKMLQPVSEE